MSSDDAPVNAVIEDALVNAVGLLLVSSDDRRSFNDALARWPDGSSFDLALISPPNTRPDCLEDWVLRPDGLS